MARAVVEKSKEGWRGVKHFGQKVTEIVRAGSGRVGDMLSVDSCACILHVRAVESTGGAQGRVSEGIKSIP